MGVKRILIFDIMIYFVSEIELFRLVSEYNDDDLIHSAKSTSV